ncbi:PREDICTED: peroxisomal membrane protein 11B [Dufourea novaeangliae]|uniref:Peroxisomal membrane protein 11B n=1 Tax=Dufourea novaeangliae TaxID=178035 RepID=A0A154P6J6_DUFNO|nr:PREDICTED: peroxisomal membrane protein 11B [Dufourea novaeangliae]KZC07566.1 Peroxisomal membrane protein 11B [Dufourea novaeangliae]
MDKIIKLNEQTAGRDRLIRLLQYGSRAYWYYAQNVRTTQHSAEILRSLEYTFSSFRKLLRLGRCLDSLYAAVKMMKYPDGAIRVLLTASKIANALFLLTDHIIWIGRVGLHKVNIEKWSKTANKYWLINIIINLIRDVYEIIKILENEGKNALLKTSNVSFNAWKQYKVLLQLKNHKEVVMDTIKNGCDLFIPLTALGFTKFTPGTIGIFGIISSLVGLYTIIHPLYKLTPC